ncbi:MAG: carbohydrate-binding domain-containing protein [Oscillospiraceae bacterium]|nr:carbohydrate-binding domain-containing protein [Oscillospiraceae bacterium]
MKYPTRQMALLLCAAILLLSACGAKGIEAESGDPPQAEAPAAPASANAAAVRTPSVLDLTEATVITLSGGGASVEGSGAAAEGGVVTITAAGIYAVSGSLEDGRIIVNAPKEDVTVALNGADIACSYGSPLYIYKAGTATVHLVEGTKNTLADGASYTYDDAYSSAADEEPNACLYSKADLVIEGAGELEVTASFDNGITSKDTLQIYDARISVSAVNNGINGKDSHTIDSADITVTCGGDAIRSTNDTDGTLGWISISNAALDLTAGEDGIQAETALTMSDGSYRVTSGGGSGVQPSDDTSAKGLKAGTVLTLTGGAYTLDCSDDAIHSNGDVAVSGGSYTISTGDDALHADEGLTVSGGEIDILASYEGLEGTTVTVLDGTIRIVSSDDGVNAAGGADSSGFGGFGRGNTFGGSDPNAYIDISGGYLVVQAGGDGLDSNGNAVISGGTVIVSSTGQADGALDYDGSFTLSGGTLLAASSGNMAQFPSEASQYTLSLGFNGALPAGTYVSLAGEDQSFVWELPASANNIVFSSPDLEGGAAYTVSYGGEYSGQSVDGICSGGAYSGGTELTVLTLSDYITTYGNTGMGNMGGRPGGGMGGRPDGDMSGMPDGDMGDRLDGGMGGRPDGDMGGEPWGSRDGSPEDGAAPGDNGMPEGQRSPGRQGGMPPEEDAGRGEPPEDGFPGI